MAKDFYHDVVRLALEKEGWQITHDPYEIKGEAIGLFDSSMKIDLGAEKMLAAERENEKIAVEIKTLNSQSLINELHTVVGQYLNYQIGLDIQEPNRVLYLAIPLIAYNRLENQLLFKKIIQKTAMKLIIYDLSTNEICLWLN